MVGSPQPEFIEVVPLLEESLWNQLQILGFCHDSIVVVVAVAVDCKDHKLGGKRRSTHLPIEKKEGLEQIRVGKLVGPRIRSWGGTRLA